MNDSDRSRLTAQAATLAAAVVIGRRMTEQRSPVVGVHNKEGRS